MIEDDGLAHTLQAAAHNYRHIAGLCGVSYGAKFSSGKRQEGVSAVQFFVAAKREKKHLKRCLPGYVYGRLSDGTLNRGQRIRTDVIEVRNLEMACVAGDEAKKVGGAGGSATLIFENQNALAKTLMITCSHVAGNMSVSPELGELRGGSVQCFFQAQVIGNTVIANDALEFDIAICEITNSPQLESLGVRGSAIKCAGFGTAADLALDTELECVSVVSETRTISVQSETTTFREVRTPAGNVVTIRNLLACKGIADRGDSGGLVFKDDRAVGIIVAKADDDWVFIHNLESAVNHLVAECGEDIVPFPAV